MVSIKGLINTMRVIGIITIFLFLFHPTMLTAQNVTDDIYYTRLYYTCKVWGYVKYFHPKVADCSVDYDQALLQALPKIKKAKSDAEYRNTLLEMISTPGDVPVPTTPSVSVQSNLCYNLNLGWMNDTIFNSLIKNKLILIRNNFRPRTHCLVGQAFEKGNPTFEHEKTYSSTLFSSEEYRLLALFRYWNIIRYFYPYSSLMDQNWEVTLKEFIPRFSKDLTELDYHMTFLELATRINDTHAYTSSSVINSFFGYYYPEFSVIQIGNETVVSQVAPTITNLKPGDVIQKINHVDIDVKRDSYKKYVIASNKASYYRELNDYILRGPTGAFTMEIQDSKGTKNVTLNRNITHNYFYSYFKSQPLYQWIVENDNCRFVVVNMGVLKPEDIPSMGKGFWNSDCIIFDIRNYPNGTLWYLVNYLFPGPLHVAKFTYPDINYPGTLGVNDVYIGAGGSSLYKGKIILLFNEQTQSQAEYTCMGLEQFPGAIKIGSQTAGADGNITKLNIMGDITTIFTGLGTFYGDSTETQRIGIVPDITVLPTIEGLRQGRDEVLERALDCRFVTKVDEILANNDELKIFPNPAHNLINIETNTLNDKGLLTISNVHGQLLFQQPLTQMTTKIDVSNFSKGIYLVTIQNGQNSTTKKFLRN